MTVEVGDVMTQEEFDEAQKDASFALQEIGRLKALLRKVEFVPSCCFDEFCPFCGSCQSYRHEVGGRDRGHAPDCPAFAEKGRLK
jgi:hypothetical protein